MKATRIYRVPVAPKGTPFTERFWRRVVKGDGCWAWLGFHSNAGYARFSIKAGYGQPAHVVAYELLVGPVPPGTEIDHICNNRGCVNPAHLRPLSHLENTRRGKLAEHGSTLTHCKRGHERTPENTLLRKGRGPLGECKACHRECERERLRRKARGNVDAA